MRITNGGYVLEENKDSSSKTIIQFIVSGEQVNISTDNGTVNANQNNETKMVEKQIIIENNLRIIIRIQMEKVESQMMVLG